MNCLELVGVVFYPLSDHLGSTTITTDAAGAAVSELRYTPWGKTRFESGSSLMEYKFTGQYSNESDFGLYYFNARWYDPYLKQFSSPDSLVPDPYNSLDYNRYGYARENPVRYNDPTGHCVASGQVFDSSSSVCQWTHNGQNSGNSNAVDHSYKKSKSEEIPTYQECLLACHKSVEPQQYSVPALDPSKVDWLHAGSNAIGLVGDVATVVVLMDPVPGDEVVVIGGATLANGISTGANVVGLGVDIRDFIKTGYNNGQAIDIALILGGAKFAVIRASWLKTAVPIIGFPYHASGLWTAFSPSFSIITVGGNK